ncbi:RhoGEF domain protein [Rhizoctonia solani AG-3 Rhs1AP]|uniref:RhoGEF domain protein n=1 Tax=Rhizoctonia solani AG-3 Rhs1AP TaxID=1086054 RepID=X8J643_9AGAM|nr:RhoGEF domain protein [Rhizoctonia solani AG-3 Rhs1AP]
MPMASLTPRLGPAAIQRANSLQASDTSHTSASTTDASTSNTSESASPIKPSPVSSIGESIGGSPVAPMPVCTVPLRATRPLPIPPTASPALTSTSTLKLSHQESQSTLGKSSLRHSHTASRRDRSRPPPSSFTPHQTDDDRWVSISVLPALSERIDASERQADPGSRATKHKRSASADPKLVNTTSVGSKATFPKHSTRIIPAQPKDLPQLPLDAQSPPTRQAETSWKLEFRGVVKLVRWVSRWDRRVDSGVENERVERVDEKDPGVERSGYSVASLGRKNRGQPRPVTGPISAPSRLRPTSLARPHPKLEMRVVTEDEGKEPSKRRLTKSNPIMFGRASSELKKQPSIELKKKGSKTELAKRSGRRASSDAARKVLSGTAHNLDRQSGADGAGGPSVDASLGMALNGGGVFVPESSLSVPSNSALGAFIRQVEPTTGPSLPGSGGAPVPHTTYSPPYLRNPTPAGVAPALLTHTTITQTSTTTATLASPNGFTSTPFAFSIHSSVPTSAAMLTPVLEGQLVRSPLPIEASEFPWTTVAIESELTVGVAVSGGFSPTESNAISSIVSIGGASPVISSIGPSTSNMSNATSSAVSPLMSNASPLFSNTASPLTSSATSPLMSNGSSPMMHVSSLPMSSTTSPLLFSSVPLSEGLNYVPNHASSNPTSATSSSLSYATARSNGNGVSVQVDPAALMRYGAATDIGHDSRYLSASDAHFGAATHIPRFSAAATDLGHGGTSTRATSPTPSDRYAISDDVHEYRPTGVLLRALSGAEHSDAPLPRPFKPFMAARESNGSGVTFDDSSAQSSPRIGARRKMMTMSSSDVGHGQQIKPAKHQVQRSSSSLSVAGRIVRAFSIGSNKAGQESETEVSRVTRKLTRKKMHSRTGSMVSLVIPGSSVPPVPPLPPGVTPGRYTSEHGHGDGSALGHGESLLGHGDSELGHSQYATACDGSSSMLGHGDPSAISPAPTRNSFATTHSAPTTVSGGRKLKKRQPGTSRHSEVFGRTLASLELPSGASSRDPPRITTEFMQMPLVDEDPLTASVCGTTEDGHLLMAGLPRRTSSQRRWTIADMDDEEFLRQLEVKLSGAGGRLRKSRMLEDFAMGVDGNDLMPEDDQDSDSDDSVAEREWIRARRAMMCVREIVRTEKSYMRHLIAFVGGDDITGMSPILVEHLPRLIETSRIFCARLEEDPSAKGVSEAFLALESVLDATFVQWSSVVGEVISSAQRTDSQATSDDGHTSAGTGITSRRRSATGSSGRMPSFPLTLSMTPVNGGNSKNKKSSRGTKSKRMTEQDVIIMPTQRAIRYELMYRALLLYTPITSPSRPLVERALQGATRIARRCDEAQNHTDHIFSPS